MENLVFVYSWGDEGCSGTATIPFQYESKDKFIYDMLEKFDSKYWKERHMCTILECWINKEEFECIERYIYTLENWFEMFKTEI
jgi:hypothetical protein